VSIPRIGCSIDATRPVPCVLQAEVSQCCATLDCTSRVMLSAESAVFGVRPAQPAAARGSFSSNAGTVLMQAPCSAFVLLHHRDPHDMLKADRSRPALRAPPQSFIEVSFRPSGVEETQAETQAEVRQALPLPKSATPHSRQHSAAGEPLLDAATPSTSQPELDTFSSRPSLSASEAAAFRDSMRESRNLDLDGNSEILRERTANLSGRVVFGSAMAKIAPVEAFMDSTSLVCLLELGLKLRTLIHQGDVLLTKCVLARSCPARSPTPACRAYSSAAPHAWPNRSACLALALQTIRCRALRCRSAGCGSTAQAALEAGNLPALVHNGLVKHRIAIQGMSPPIIPSIFVTCGGLVMRLGMLGHSQSWPSPPDMQSGPVRRVHPDKLDPREYDFIISVIDVRGAVAAQLDTTHHAAAASACYDMSAHFDVEAGFKQGRISSLLQDRELSVVVREAHETAVMAWMHPSDDEAILEALKEWQQRGKYNMYKEQKQCASSPVCPCLSAYHASCP
jgi:hypothetical protein